MLKNMVKVGSRSNDTAVNHVFETKLRLNADKFRNDVGATDPDARNADHSKDILGRVYEYFLTQFASAEGKNGEQFDTACCVVRVLVEMLTPYKGRVYDPCCGSAGMFVQSEKFAEEHGGRICDIAVYRQKSNSMAEWLFRRSCQLVLAASRSKSDRTVLVLAIV